MLLQIIHVITGCGQRRIVRAADRHHDIAACFTQCFDFAVLRVVGNTVSGAPRRYTGVSIFSDHKGHGEVVNVLVFRQTDKVRLHI
ncbi:hypothetical protein SRABI106_00120 [Rahnella aquatilis]|nr:hypothetical protein SRABI106_00120 [Rahnella aquatilis]